MIGAFAYLTVTSTRNKLVSQAKRLRNPRYAIALLLGLAYFWMIFFNRSAQEGRDAGLPVGPALGTILPVFILLYVAYTWIVGTDRSALAFSEAEVAMLFTAPVSRRGLIIYKLVRAQVGVLTTSVIWLLLFHRQNSGWERVMSSWAFLSIFSLHRLGAALVRAASTEHGARGFRRSFPAVALFGIALFVVAKGLFDARGELTADADFQQFEHTILTAFASPPMSWVLYPFRIAVAPMFATTNAEWARAMPAALALLALHFWWVLRSDSAFEEAAAEASSAMAKRLASLRTPGVSHVAINAKARRRTLKLRPTGPPAVAIVWKNILWLVRTGQVRGLVGLPLFALVCVLAFAGRSDKAEVIIVVMCSAVSFMILIFGPMSMRNDLRGELRRLPMLKTLPLSGRDIIFAEVVSSASPTAAMQFLLVAIGLLAMSFTQAGMLPLDVRLGALIGAPVFVLGLNLANFTVHNGLALLFPGWVRLGETGVAGIEAMGQMMLTSIVTLVMLGLLLIVPALTVAVLFVTMHWPPLAAVAASGMVAGFVLGAESYLLMGALGGSLDRLEPAHVG